MPVYKLRCLKCGYEVDQRFTISEFVKFKEGGSRLPCGCEKCREPNAKFEVVPSAFSFRMN